MATTGFRKLLLAVKKNSLAELEKALAAGEDVCHIDADGNSILHICAEHGSEPVFEALLAAGADVKHHNLDGEHVLHTAARFRQLGIVQLLLDRGIDPNTVDSGKEGRTALTLAARMANQPLAALLVRAGANINHRETGGWEQSILEAACRNLDMVNWLLAMGADPNAADSGGRTAIWAAIEGRKLEVVQALHAHGAQLDVRDQRGRTPLMHAMWMNLPTVVTWLLDQGVDATATDNEGASALQFASAPDSEAAAVLQARLAALGVTEAPSTDDYLRDLIRKARADWQAGGMPTFKADLSGSAIGFEALPRDLSEFHDLQHLTISNAANLLEIPDQIAQLTSLRVLEIRNCRQLQRISPSIGKLGQLERLVIFYAWSLKELPDAFGSLGALQHLEVYGGEMTHLPASLAALPALRTLILVDINLGQVPDLSALSQLERLTLMKLNLAGELPAWILKLSRLQELDISDNGIARIPREIVHLPLSKFAFKGNRHTYPPKEAGKNWETMRTWFLAQKP